MKRCCDPGADPNPRSDGVETATAMGSTAVVAARRRPFGQGGGDGESPFPGQELTQGTKTKKQKKTP